MKCKSVVKGIFLFLLIVGFVSVTMVCAEPTEKPPIKMGILLSLTGPYTMVGEPTLKGVQLAYQKRDYKIAGRKIELIVEDEEGKPDVGHMKTKKLVEKDNVQVIFGPVLSSTAYAIKDYLRSAKVPLMMICCGAIGLTRENISPYYFRTWHNGAGPYYGAKWAYEKKGCRKAIFAGVDYAYGRELGDSFAKGFTASGGTMVGEVYTALGTKDFGPYLTKMARLIQDAGADCLGWVYAGSDAVGFVTQLQEYGLRDKFKVVINYAGTILGKTVEMMGPAVNGHYDICPYYKYLDNAANREYIKLLEKTHGPGYLEAMGAVGYLGGDVIAMAIDQVKGNIEDKPRFLEAIRNVRYDSIFGPFEFDPKDQNQRLNLNVLQWKWINGKPDCVLIDTYPKTRDWWWATQMKK
ncbi:MAG: ABC transporter substrate-binding protein [Thermodesulfobacteriota bacterium]